MSFRPSHFFALLLLAAIGLVSCSNDYGAAGRRAFSEGAFGRATELLQIALEADPKADDLRYLYAISLSRTGRLDPAVQQFERLLTNEELRSQAARRLVEVLLAANRTADADRKVRAALEQAPDDPLLLQALGDIQKHDYEKKLALVNRELEARLGPRAPARLRWIVQQTVAADGADFRSRFETMSQQVAAAGYGTNTSTLEALFQDARAALLATKTAYDRVLLRDPTAFAPRLFLGTIAIEARDLPRAGRLFREVALLDPSQIKDPQDRLRVASARYQAVNLYREGLQRAQQIDEAIAFIDEVEPSFKNTGPLLSGLCSLDFQAERIDSLEERSNQLLRLEPRNPWASFYKGFVLYRRQKYHDACLYLTRARDSSPRNPEFNRYLGLALLRSGSLARALPHVELALEGRKDAELVIGYAEALEKAGDVRRAQKVLSEAVVRWFRNAKSDDHRLSLQALQALYVRVGVNLHDVSAARSLYRDDPSDTFVALRLADLERESGSFERAREVLREVIGHTPDLPEAWLVLARIELGARNWNAAESALEKLDDLDPGRPDTPWMKAESLLRRREIRKARAAAELAISRDPESPARATLLRIGLADNDAAGVVAAARDLLKMAPDDVEYLSALADGERALGHVDEEIAALNRLAKDQATDFDLRLRLADALLRAKDGSGARTHLELAATFPTLTNAQRVALGRALHRAGASQLALSVLDPVCESTERGQDRTAALIATMWIHHGNRDRLRVLEAFTELRRSGEMEAAAADFIAMATQQRAYHEAVAVLDRARQTSDATPRARRLAIPALVAVGRFQDAAGEIESLTASGELAPNALLMERLRVALATQNTDFAQILGPEIASLTAEQIERLGVAWIEHRLQAGKAESALSVLDPTLSLAPDSVALMVAAARVCLAVQDTARARSLLERARSLNPDDPRAQRLLSAVLVGEGQFAAAAAVGTRDDADQSLLRCLAGLAPPTPNTLGEVLFELAAGHIEQALDASTRVSDLPGSFREALAGFLRTAASIPDAGPAIALGLARQTFLARVGILGASVISEIAVVEESLPPLAPFLRPYRAHLLHVYGRSNEAALTVVPLLDGRGQDPYVLYVAAVSALTNVGPENLMVLVEGQLGQRFPGTFAYDIALSLAGAGRADLALRVLARATAPSADALALRARLAHRTGDLALAARCIAALPPALRDVPSFRLVSAHALCLDPETRANGIAALEALLANVALRDELDPFAVLGAVAAADRDDAVHEWLSRCLESAPYDAETLQRVLRLLAGPLRNRALEQRVQSALSSVDPLVKLRGIPREQRKLPGL